MSMKSSFFPWSSRLNQQCLFVFGLKGSCEWESQQGKGASLWFPGLQSQQDETRKRLDLSLNVLLLKKKTSLQTSDPMNTTIRGCIILTLSSTVSLHTHTNILFTAALHRTCCATKPCLNHEGMPTQVTSSLYVLYSFCRGFVIPHLREWWATWLFVHKCYAHKCTNDDVHTSCRNKN